MKVITAEMAGIAEVAAAEARHLATNARRGLRRAGQAASGSVVALVAELERTAAAIERVAAQTRTRLSGETPGGAARVVSLHDTTPGPSPGGAWAARWRSAKGPGGDNADGIVLDHEVVKGNPPDGPMLVPAIARIAARFAKVPRAVTADRGYGEAAIDAGLEALGVKKVVIPRKGKPGAARRQVQARRSFRRMVKWRTGSEARVSSLKQDHGWRRTLMDGIGGAETWCGWGVLANKPPRSTPCSWPRPHRRSRPGLFSQPGSPATGPPGRRRPASAA